MTIRLGTTDDLPAIERIQRESPGSSAWDSEAYTRFDLHVVESEGRVVAFIVTRRVAADEHEILNVAVAPEYRRQGIARDLVREVISTSRGAWFLEVRESNQSARALYCSLGFEPVGVRQNYYSDPVEPAIVMRFYS